MNVWGYFFAILASLGIGFIVGVGSTYEHFEQKFRRGKK